MPRKIDIFAAALALSLFLSAVAFVPHKVFAAGAQQQERRKPKPDLGAGQSSQGKQGYKVGVSVDLVVVHTTVLDHSGNFVSGLKKEAFKLYEDGIGQEVASFSQEDVPISMGIVLDTSGSMRDKFDRVNKAALAFIRASNPDDQVFLIGFNDEVELLEDFTSDIDLITDTLNNTIVTGGTALYDAIYLSVQKAQSGERPKKAVVVITDGEDKDSYYSLEELISKVQESDVQVYTVGFLNPVPDKGLFGHWSKSVPEKAQEALQRISEETGAKAFFPKSVDEIHTIVAEIAYELRNQYSIGYISSNKAHDGSWRRIKIAVDPSAGEKCKVRYRSGYFAPKPDSDR